MTPQIILLAAVCFSPGSCDQNLVDLINSANLSIDVAIYDLNLPNVADALIEKNKSTPVRVVCDKRQSRSDKNSLIGKLAASGIPVRYGRQKGIMHDKFVVVDNREIETGSFNYTHHATVANHENQIYISDPNVAQKYEAAFSEIWEGGEAVH